MRVTVRFGGGAEEAGGGRSGRLSCRRRCSAVTAANLEPFPRLLPPCLNYSRGSLTLVAGSFGHPPAVDDGRSGHGEARPDNPLCPINEQALGPGTSQRAPPIGGSRLATPCLFASKQTFLPSGKHAFLLASMLSCWQACFLASKHAFLLASMLPSCELTDVGSLASKTSALGRPCLLVTLARLSQLLAMSGYT